MIGVIGRISRNGPKIPHPDARTWERDKISYHVMLCGRVDFKKGRSPRWVNVVTQAHKSRECSLGSGKEVSKRRQGSRRTRHTIAGLKMKDTT